MKTYASKLKNPAWQKKRLEVLNYAKWRCQICGDKESELHVHHSYYLKGKQPWQHPVCSMISVCDKHHAMIHESVPGKPIKPKDPVPEERILSREEALKQFTEFRRLLADENKDR